MWEFAESFFWPNSPNTTVSWWTRSGQGRSQITKDENWEKTPLRTCPQRQRGKGKNTNASRKHSKPTKQTKKQCHLISCRCVWKSWEAFQPKDPCTFQSNSNILREKLLHPTDKTPIAFTTLQTRCSHHLGTDRPSACEGQFFEQWKRKAKFERARQRSHIQ